MAVMTDVMRGKVWQFAECVAFISMGSLAARLGTLFSQTDPEREEIISATTIAFIVSKTIYFATRGIGAACKLDPSVGGKLGWGAGLLSASFVFSEILEIEKTKALAVSLVGAGLGVTLREGIVKGVDVVANAAIRV